MADDNKGVPTLDAWLAESIRVTTFPSEVVSTEQLTWWDSFVGSPAETITSRPKIGQYVASGDFEGRRLTLHIQPGRIEWNLSPTPRDSDEEFAPPSLGLFSEALASLLKVASAWLPHAPALNRIAFGAVLTQPVADRRAGYVLLQHYLKSVKIDPDGSSDLSYQINRPRPSAYVEGLPINRLSKWSVQLAQRVTMTVGSENIVTRALMNESSCRLELDVNTAPNILPALPPQQLGSLLQEAVDFGRELALSGDIP